MCLCGFCGSISFWCPRHPLLSSLPARALSLFLSRCFSLSLSLSGAKAITFDKDDIIIHEGNRDQRLYQIGVCPHFSLSLSLSLSRSLVRFRSPSLSSSLLPRPVSSFLPPSLPVARASSLSFCLSRSLSLSFSGTYANAFPMCVLVTTACAERAKYPRHFRVVFCLALARFLPPALSYSIPPTFPPSPPSLFNTSVPH